MPAYYETMDGYKCDKGIVDACREAVKGQGDGRVSVEDAAKVFKEIADAGKETQCERWTARYCLTEFHFTETAHDWLIDACKGLVQENADKENGEEPAAKKQKVEEADQKKSYYEKIDGMELDAAVVDACRAAVAGKGDGRVSLEDAKCVFEKVADGNKVTQCERWTVRYCLQEFKWTRPAATWMVESMQKAVHEQDRTPTAVTPVFRFSSSVVESMLSAMSLSLLFFAMAATGATAFCPCVGVPNGMQFTTCTEPWAKAGTCMKAQRRMYNGEEATLPPDYALGCHVHPEPFSADCTNQTTGQTLASPAQWCTEPWCFVDPCTCDAHDLIIAESAYGLDAAGEFVQIAYSYSNCDGVDAWNPTGQLVETTDTFRAEHCSMKCGEIRDYYRDQECCGMPEKMIPYPMFYPFNNELDGMPAAP